MPRNACLHTAWSLLMLLLGATQWLGLHEFAEVAGELGQHVLFRTLMVSPHAQDMVDLLSIGS